jgi:hypothetical protein
VDPRWAAQQETCGLCEEDFYLPDDCFEVPFKPFPLKASSLADASRQDLLTTTAALLAAEVSAFPFA